MSARTRNTAFLTERPLDVLIIGGGIVGASVARDAAMRGLRTGLVDKADFASGTSSRSSRLLHGGLRYLAQGRIGLVREAGREKAILHRIAPHLASLLPFVFPAYRGNRQWTPWKLRIGVRIYDLLCGGRNQEPSCWMSADRVHARIPGLRREGLAGGVRYFDGLTNDARLVIDTLRSAEQHGAAVLNYCRLVGAERNGRWNCQVHDIMTEATLTVATATVVNATGPWAEELPHSSVRLRLTKGIHLVVSREKLPVPETVVLTEGSRILFAIPWGERVILGTTDTDFSGPPEEVYALPEDVRYILEVANRFFPDCGLSEPDVIRTWAGIRPLLFDPKGRPSDISRSHQILNPEPGWWDVAGGKLTTCRRMAEQTVDRLVAAAGLSAQPCRTAKESLVGGRGPGPYSGILPPEFCRDAVRHFCEAEWAVHLDDVMIRRSGWHSYLPDAGDIAAQAAEWMSLTHGWNPSRQHAEVERYRQQLSITATNP